MGKLTLFLVIALGGTAVTTGRAAEMPARAEKSEKTEKAPASGARAAVEPPPLSGPVPPKPPEAPRAAVPEVPRAPLPEPTRAAMPPPAAPVATPRASESPRKESRRSSSREPRATVVRPGDDAVDPSLAVTPPSLATSALRAELWRKPAAGPVDERTAARSERARLEELVADIARAREQLRQDTARLEATLQGRRRPAGEQPAGAPVEMGTGEPLQQQPPAPLAAGPTRGQVDVVSKAMKGMKPEQAAAILARLDRGLAAEIVRRMPAADAGAVLAQLKPEIAADLATEIATRPPRGDSSKKPEEKR